MPNPISLEQMSRRYTHAEREGISCGTLGRGDITSWARPTSAFKRPEVAGRPPISNPAKPMHEYGIRAIEAPHKPEAVCLPANSKPDPRLDMARAGVIAEVNDRLMKGVIKRAKRKAFPKPVEVNLLAESDTAQEIKRVVTNWLGQKIEVTAVEPKTVERECEPHNDTPLPYDRACKANNWRR